MKTTSFRHARPLLLAVLASVALAMALPAVAAPARNNDDPEFLKGHVALDRDHYRQAAEHFENAAERADDDDRAESLYWYAFALSRTGKKDELRQAADALLQLNELDADRDLLREARSLAARVKGDLAGQGDAKAARELAEMADMADAKDDIDTKLVALQAMIHMNPERTRPILAEILRNREPGTEELREQAIFVLSQGGADESADLIIDAARHDPDPDVRDQAFFWLAQSGSDAALDLYRDLLANEEDPEVLDQVVFAVAQLGTDAGTDLLRDLAADADRPTEIRSMAMFGLGNADSPENREFLQKLYGGLDDPELKEQVLHAVAQHGGKDVGDWLVSIATDTDEDPDARDMALFWAGQQGLLTVSRLEAMYAQSDDLEFREQIIFVLSQTGSDEALEMLMTIAREEQDRELRTQAIFWIGQVGGEDAETFLLELINK